MSDGEEILNAPAARRAAETTGGGGEGESARDALVRIASAQGLFGSVPEGAAAESALASAAACVLDAWIANEVTVEDISASASGVADIADETDEAAHTFLLTGEAAGTSLDYTERMLEGEELTTVTVHPWEGN
ncbi:hypothetical protein ACWGNE_13180 [Streptomyces xiamenensis]|uniref:hypothetical protein n=1 Tax=Streptomyces xiamenensis TaxID=408015 RepID=UPI00368E7B77